MFDFFKRGRSLVAEIEELITEDLDAAASRFTAVQQRLSSAESSRLADLLRRRLAAREHNAYLSRALAEGSISPTAALELLETYEQAGYVDAGQASMHRRHAVEAHRRELQTLLATPNTDRLDYFRLLDGYRAAGYLRLEELSRLQQLIEVKLNPEIGAKRLFAEAQVAVDPSVQAELLHRYLMQFQGFEDYPQAACLYLGLRVDAHWRQLDKLRSARDATLKIQELNSLLHAYLPHTSDLSEYVPIDQIVADFREHARHFDPKPGADSEVTDEDVDRRVVVVAENEASTGSYEADRNSVVSIGKTGRVRAVTDGFVLVEHDGPAFTYTKAWGLPVFKDTRLVRIPRKSDLALWRQDEIGLMDPRRPSPVFVHQYQAAVARLASFLDRHRADNSIRLIPSGEDRETTGGQDADGPDEGPSAGFGRGQSQNAYDD